MATIRITMIMWCCPTGMLNTRDAHRSIKQTRVARTIIVRIRATGVWWRFISQCATWRHIYWWLFWPCPIVWMRVITSVGIFKLHCTNMIGWFIYLFVCLFAQIHDNNGTLFNLSQCRKTADHLQGVSMSWLIRRTVCDMDINLIFTGIS